jgi:hypothetical protein
MEVVGWIPGSALLFFGKEHGLRSHLDVIVFIDPSHKNYDKRHYHHKKIITIM